MRIVLLAFVLAAACFSPLAAQTTPTPNTVTVTVSNIQAAAAGTAAFRVQFLDANLNSSVDTALGVLSDTGASTANQTGTSVTLSQQGFVITQYDFAVNVPVDQFAGTRDKLIAAQRAIANVNTQAISWDTTYQPTPAEQAKALETALPGLLEQAAKQAAPLAAAMGGKTGKIVAMAAPAIVPAGLGLTVSATVTYAVE
ncbi:MAG: hypothetical protein IT162_15780 [Bryobacterales bacterium]|nr:hypothetical protein [Bryobacterales bacterium]